MQTYQQAMRTFNCFLHCLGYAVGAAATPSQLSEFIAWLSLQNKATATISSYVAGIAFWHKMQSLPDPTDNFVYRKLLSALRRNQSVGDQRQPISGVILQRLVGVLPSVTVSNYECTLFTTAFILAYFGLLRLGEIAVDSSSRAKGGLRTADACIQRTGGCSIVVLSLRHTKTSQYGKPQTVTLQAVPESQLCPVQAVEKFLAVRPVVGDSAAFLCHYDATPLSRYQLQAVLRKATAAIGLDPHQYTSHCFRIGAASTFSALGCSPEEIKLCGRWRSSAYRSYIRQTGAIPTRLLACLGSKR